jgi:glycogen(starch) synthase
MRITFLVTNYAPSVGGAQVHVQRVAEGLVERHGHHVSVLTTDAIYSPTRSDVATIASPAETINGVDVRRVAPARRLHAALRTARRAGRRLHLYEPSGPSLLSIGPLGARILREARRAARDSDALVGVSAPSAMLFDAEIATRGTAAAHVAMPLLHLATETPRPWVARSLRRADGVTTSTSAERDWVVGHDVDPARVVVLPPGCDPDRYPDLTQAAARARLGLPERPTVAVVGRFAVNKGLDTMAAAMDRVWEARPDTTLLLAGSRAGWDGFDDLLAGLRSRGGDRVEVREAFDDDERPVLLAAADVVAFPTRDESFGMVTVEAWCARRPVVASDIDVIRTLVSPGRNGRLVPVEDPGALADAVIGLLADPELAAAWGRAGRRDAEESFDWTSVVDRWDAFLADWVARRRAVTGPRGPAPVGR